VPSESDRKQLQNYIQQLEAALRAWLDCETKTRPRIASLREALASKIPEIQKRCTRLREVPGWPLIPQIDADQVLLLAAQMPEQMQIDKLERKCEAPRQKVRELHSAMQPCLDRFRCPELRDTFRVLDGITIPWVDPATAQRFIGLLKNSLSSPVLRPPQALGEPSDHAVLQGKESVIYGTAATFLGVSDRQIRRLVRAGKLDAQGQGQSRQITVASLRKYKVTQVQKKSDQVRT
jgi:hypothetical protein